jgi:hypothetical protein
LAPAIGSPRLNQNAESTAKVFRVREGKPELRHSKAVHVSGDAEIGLFSDDAVVNCLP